MEKDRLRQTENVDKVKDKYKDIYINIHEWIFIYMYIQYL